MYVFRHKTFTYTALDVTDRGIEAVYPLLNSEQAAAGVQFPVIAYAHGYGDGGDHVMGHYTGATHPLLEELASWGYVVLAPRSCDEGCLLSCKSLPLDPPCFGHYYHQQLMTVDWARSPASASLPINASLVAVAGHSMGGQATLFSAAYNATTHGIKAAALHHVRNWFNIIGFYFCFAVNSGGQCYHSCRELRAPSSACCNRTLDRTLRCAVTPAEDSAPPHQHAATAPLTGHCTVLSLLPRTPRPLIRMLQLRPFFS